MIPIKTKVRLEGNPIFSLVYVAEGQKIPTDVSSFRPDPREYLKKDVEYTATVFLESVTLDDTGELAVIRRVQIHTSDNIPIFVKIR